MIDLTYSSATALAAAIRNKDVSSREVVEAHLSQIGRANPPLNAVVRVLGATALDDARRADVALARGENVGPFHGVPMTVKDAWEVGGVPSTGGTLGRAAFVPGSDATVIARMRAAGAIPIAMTNLPELSFAFESDNLVHGRSNNPYDVTRTPGGSGGGGAAAIAAGMSPLEIGADLGGSIRLPCHFSGIAGIRATTGRTPMTGYFPPLLGWVSHFAAAGPMSRHVEDLEAALAVISGPDWIDARVESMPLGHAREVSIEGLRVAVHTNNGILRARSDIAATVMNAAKELSDRGAIVEEAVPTGIDQCFGIFMGMVVADAGEGLRALLSMIGTERSHPLLTGVMGLEKEQKPAGFLQGLWVQVDLYRSAMLSFFKHYDLILCPVNALPAVEHGTSFRDDVLPSFSYTIAFNLTGWPGAVVRGGTSTEGLPIGVQVVARPWREDVAIAAAQHLEVALGGYRRPALAASV